MRSVFQCWDVIGSYWALMSSVGPAEPPQGRSVRPGRWKFELLLHPILHGRSVASERVR